MLNANGLVLVVDQDETQARRIASHIQFLEYPVNIVTSEDKLSNGATSGLIAVFVRAAGDQSFLTSAVAKVEALWPGTAVFLVSEEQGDAEVPENLTKKIYGVLQEPVTYTEMLSALRAAEMATEVQKTPKGDMFNLFRSLIGDSEQIHRVRELIQQVAPTDASVLILGESGTGKEVVARNVHYFSKRRNKPFVPVNCGAIPPELLESELFGHEKGAFTGAISSRQGRFEIAEGGTLFLDEIGDMPLPMQVKLLRVLQEKSFERVGGTKSFKSDVRIIAATHQNLEHLVTEGKFRMDLYYRLDVFPINVPPLRERLADLHHLINEFITRMEREKRGSVRLSDGVIAALGKYQWPGNVRELANLIERLAILYPEGLVQWHDLPDKYRPNHDWITENIELPREPEKTVADIYSQHRLPKDGISLKDYLVDIEKDLMYQALEETNWVVARSAKLLGLQRTTMVEKVKKYNLVRDALGERNQVSEV